MLCCESECQVRPNGGKKVRDADRVSDNFLGDVVGLAVNATAVMPSHPAKHTTEGRALVHRVPPPLSITRRTTEFGDVDHNQGLVEQFSSLRGSADQSQRQRNVKLLDQFVLIDDPLFMASPARSVQKVQVWLTSS